MKDNLYNLEFIKQLLGRYHFKFSKSLGQNFIINKNICPQMANYCSKSSDSGIIEIGPGIGVLTVELAKRYKKVVSIEIDKNLIPILSETISNFSNVELINKDILKIDLQEIVKNYLNDCSEINICANLPYYITSEVIMYILESEINIKSVIIMIQKEVAERICASPGTRDIGIITMAIKYYGNAEKLFDVGRENFIPSPNVDSSVIKIAIDKNNSTNILNKDLYFKLIKAAYGKRRKNILNSLSSGMNLGKNQTLEILKSSSIEHTKRAEQLSFEDFVNLSNKFYTYSH